MRLSRAAEASQRHLHRGGEREGGQGGGQLHQGPAKAQNMHSQAGEDESGPRWDGAGLHICTHPATGAGSARVSR